MTPEPDMADGSVDDGQDALHREMDRMLDAWDDEPTHEKWHKGGKGWR
jgi:hypothetical protein